MAVVYAARSHVGWRREENEDNLYADGVTLPPDICRRPFSIDGSAVEMAANTNTVTENGADYANNACTVGIEIWTSYGAGNGSVFGGVTYTHE